MAELAGAERLPQAKTIDQRRAGSTGDGGGRLTVFLHALTFVIGFTAVFTLIGSAAGLIGQNLNLYLPTLQRIGAILLVIFGLVTLGVFRWLVSWLNAQGLVERNRAAAALVKVLDFFNTLLYTEKRLTAMHQVNRRWGYLSSALLGVSFSAGWVPCIGPILGSILFLAGDTATATQGALLLAVYSMGLGLPFLITGAAFSRMTGLLRRLNRYANVVSIISGLFLFYVAYLLWSGSLVTISSQFSFLTDWSIEMEEWLGQVTGTYGDLISLSLLSAAPLAFFAGVISFISPCVLPMVPAYIGYLSGAALNSGKT
jgi:cytochrome c-type biogenesis protein